MPALHQTVALTQDTADSGLRAGDLGAIIAIHGPHLVMGDQDLIAVRSLAAAKR